MKKLIHTLITLSGAAFLSSAVFAQEAPDIIFISENNSAQEAIEELVVEEYNATEKEALRETDMTAWEDYENVAWEDIPQGERDARYNEIKSELGLSDDDPQDLNFTRALEAAGYTVHRSTSTREEDPITGAITEDHEFWPDVGESREDDEWNLSQDQIDRLNAATLIIFSADTDHANYARGRTAGESDFSLRDQWNDITTPIISMNGKLTRTHEWDNWGWGFTYGFSGQYDTVSPIDRENTEPRFVFPDLRPQVITDDADFLAGVSQVDDQRVEMYNTDFFPELPSTSRKFDNNNNFGYPAHNNVVLELQIPSFFNQEVGEITTRDPVMIEFQAGVPGFTPEEGVPDPEEVGTPAGPRLYFAAGSAGTALWNLSDDGAQVMLNAVEKYAGEPSGRMWHGYPVDEDGFADTGIGGWLNGFVFVDNDPWIYVFSMDKYIYINDDSGWMFAPNN